MPRKARRRLSKLSRQIKSLVRPQPGTQSLRLESLEQRLLLSVNGWWDELGWRSASGGGVSWDATDRPGEAQMVLSSDGDPVVFWIDGTFNEYVNTPVPFHWEVSGDIYARQYADAIGWWDLSPGSGDNVSIGTGRQMTAAAGPDGTFVVAWVSGTGATSEIQAKMWTGQSWVGLGTSASTVGLSNDGVLNEKPDVAINGAGEVFISYTAIHPRTNQREIVVKRFASAQRSNLNETWVELHGTDQQNFGLDLTSGVSNDLANSFDASIAVDLLGKPIVVWMRQFQTNQSEIYARRWSGAAWEEFGVNAASDVSALNPGTGGISSDATQSVQPDVAVAANGDVFVTWVNWTNWTTQYDTNGQAGVFLKYLDYSADADGDLTNAAWQRMPVAEWVNGAWTVVLANFNNSTSPIDSVHNGGLAGNSTAAGEPALGWYYMPQIDTDSNSMPLVTWQGFGQLERFLIDRDNTASLPDGSSAHTPGVINNLDHESPVMGVYASYYQSQINGMLRLYSTGNTWNLGNTTPSWAPTGVRQSASPANYLCWMPSVCIGPSNEFLLSYTWRDNIRDAYSNDNEIYVQQMTVSQAGVTQISTYGRGSNIEGNELIGNIDNVTDTFRSQMPVNTGFVRMGLIDYDNNPATEMDILWANGIHLYVYDRSLDTWITNTTIDTGYGRLFDLKGDPFVETGVSGQWSDDPAGTTGGGPLLAYLDNTVNQWNPMGLLYLPYVRRWDGNTWDPVPSTGAPAYTAIGNYVTVDEDGDGSVANEPMGISVQAGTDGQIMLAYLQTIVVNNDDITRVITRLWNGSAWTNPGNGNGLLPASSAEGLAYYSDYNGFNFDGASLNNVSWVLTAGNALQYRRDIIPWHYAIGSWYAVPFAEIGNGGADANYVVNNWVFDPTAVRQTIAPFIPDPRIVSTIIALTKAEVSDEAGVNGQPAISATNVVKAADSGIRVTLTDPDNTSDAGAIVVANGGMSLVEEMDYCFELVADANFIIEFSYELETAGNQINLDIVIDNTVVWSGFDLAAIANTPESAGYFTDEATAGAGRVMTNPPITIDMATPASYNPHNSYQAAALTTLANNGFYNSFTGLFVAGKHHVGFRARMNATSATNADVKATMELDHVAAYQRVNYGGGASLWQIVTNNRPPLPGMGRSNVIGNNDKVGPGDVYNFQENLYVGSANATNTITIPFISNGLGDVTINFRYCLDDWGRIGPSLTPPIPLTYASIQVAIDGTNYDHNGQQNSIVLPSWMSTATRLGSFTSDWDNGKGGFADVEYTYTRVVAPNLQAGNHVMTITLTDPSGRDDLWVDNISIIAPRLATSYLNPQVTLLPNRHFAVGVNTVNPDLMVHGDADPLPDHTVSSYEELFFNRGYWYPKEWNTRSWQSSYDWDGFPQGYVSAQIMEWNGTAWDQLGKYINGTIDVNILGINNASEQDLSRYSYPLPSSDSYLLTDMTIGSQATLWVSLQHAASEEVRYSRPQLSSRDIYYTDFIIHPWTFLGPMSNSSPWTDTGTALDVKVWYFDSFTAGPPMLNSGVWIDTGLVPNNTGHAYTNPLIVGSPSQFPTVTWMTRGENRDYHQSAAQQYNNLTDTWSLLTTLTSLENIQNNFDVNWGITIPQDIVCREDGFPIIAYYAKNLIGDAVREFRPDRLLPELVLSTDLVNMGSTVETPLQTTITITNRDDPAQLYEGDLIVYGLDFGGLGSLPAAAFELRGAPAFPFTLTPGQAQSFVVSFDPTVTGVVPGIYNSVLLVHSNNARDTSHPFGHYKEINLSVEVLSEGNIYVTPETDELVFDDTEVGDTSATREVRITNYNPADPLGLLLGPLTISEWAIPGLSFSIQSATVTRINTQTGQSTTTSISTTNRTGTLDDIPALAQNEYITLNIAFSPDELNAVEDILYVMSDDSDKPIAWVDLSGNGTADAGLTVTESSGTANDNIIEFGNVVFGQLSTQYTIRINVAGTTPVTIQQITVNSSDIELDPASTTNRILVPGTPYDVKVRYKPVGNPATGDIQSLNAVLTIDTDVLANYTVSLIGLGVPNQPVVQILETSGTANDNRLAFGTIPLTINNVNQTVTQTFQIDNVGGANLTNYAFAFASGANSLFSVSPTPQVAGTITPAQAPVTFTVTFDPVAAGAFTDTLTITYYRGTTAVPQQIALSASAINPQLNVTDTQGDSTDKIIQFGNISFGQSAQQTVTLTNAGTTNLTISGWSLANDTAGVFAIDPAFGAQPITLTPNQTRTITVTFTPKDNTSGYTASFVVQSSDPDGATTTVALSGGGQTPGIATITDTEKVTPEGTINFGTIIAGQATGVQTVTITNTGAGILRFDKAGHPINVTISSFVVNTDMVPAQLNPGEHTDITVSFNPPNAMNAMGTLSIPVYDDLHSWQTLSVILTGQASSPIVADGRPYLDGQGNSVIIKVSGPGTAQIVPDDLPGSNIDRILLQNTTAKTTVTIVSSGMTTIGSIEGGTLGTLSLKKVQLDDEGLVLGALSKGVSGGDFINSADINIGQALGKGIKMMLGNLGVGSDVVVAGNVSLFQCTNTEIFGNLIVKDIAGGGGTLSKFNAPNALLSGAINAAHIGTINLGSMLGADISTAGTIKSVAVRDSFINSRILAGFDLGDDGRLGGSSTNADTLYAGGLISKVNVRGKIKNSFVSAGVASTGDFFTPTAVQSGSIGSVRFGSYENSGNAFGVSATTNIKSVVLSGDKVSPGGQIGDFAVRLLSLP